MRDFPLDPLCPVSRFAYGQAHRNASRMGLRRVRLNAFAALWNWVFG